MKIRFFRRSACLFVLLFCFSPPAVAERVMMVTNMGNIDIILFDDIAPNAVANFLNYIKDGDYDYTFIHRSIPGFVIQGGGWIFDGSVPDPVEVEKDAPIANEFSVSNLRGTIAMAKLPDQPDSATSEWFFNLADNSENLDSQNGDFTVFGQVTEQSLDVIDVIAALTVYDGRGAFSVYNSAFGNLPLIYNSETERYSVVSLFEILVASDIDGNIDDNWTVDLADAVLGLQIISGSSGESANLNSDVNSDGRFGMAEVIYIFHKVAELR